MINILHGTQHASNYSHITAIFTSQFSTVSDGKDLGGFYFGVFLVGFFEFLLVSCSLFQGHRFNIK